MNNKSKLTNDDIVVIRDVPDTTKINPADDNLQDYQVNYDELDFDNCNIKPKRVKQSKLPKIHWFSLVLIVLLLAIVYEYGGNFRSPVEMEAVNELLMGIPIDFEADYIGYQQWARSLEILDTKFNRIDSKSFEDQTELRIVYENNDPDRHNEKGMATRRVTFIVRDGRLLWIEFTSEGVGQNLTWDINRIGTLTETTEWQIVKKLGLPHSKKRGPSFPKYKRILQNYWQNHDYLNWLTSYFAYLYDSQLTYNCKDADEKFIYKLKLNFINGFLRSIKLGRVPENEMNLY